MLRKSTLVCLLTALCSVAGAPAFAHEAVRLENGRWLDEGRFLERTMYMVDGVLAADGPEEMPEEGNRTIDLGGGFVVPPLADAHSHALADAQDDQESERFLARGIFYVQNDNSIRSWAEEAREKAARPDTVDVTYAMGGLTSSGGHPSQIYDQAAAHLEGWTPERMRGEAYVPIDREEDLEAAWPAVLAGRPDFIKAYLEHSELHGSPREADEPAGRRGLDPALLPSIVRRAHDAGLRVAAHVTTANDFRVAVAAGVAEIAHLPLERLEPADAQAAAEAGVVVVTTTISHRPADGVENLDAVHRHNLRLLAERGVPLVLGTDNGARSVVDEADNLVRLGLEPAVVLGLLTGETPRWIFPHRTIGRLRPGAEASFLVLSSDPRSDLGALREPRLIVKQGRIVDTSPSSARPGIGQALAPTLMHDGVEAAVAEFHRMMREEPDAWDASEPQLNALRYLALNHGKADDAVVLFRLNAERFPTSANVWDSLGDGLAAAGDRDGALESYRHALELDPGAENTREKLDRLEAEPPHGP